VSPSGDYVAFVSGVFGPRADLFLAHLPTGRVRPLTNRADLPRWSPDGRHILFISNRDGPADLWQISINPADGSSVGDPRKLTTALETTTFAVAPDGKQILAVKEGAETHLWSFPLGASIGDVKTGTKLTTGAVRDRRGRWSHDGSGIYFESLRRGSFDIWRLMVVGGKLDRLSVAEGSELRPRPSPNGDWVAFDLVDHRGEFTHLMRPDGSLVHPLHDSWFSRYSQVCCADWSPDGSRLALAVSMRNGNRSSTIAIATVDRTTGTASALRVLTTLPGGAPEYGRWSPDGRFVVYEALTDGSWDLWIVDPDAPTPRRLTTFASNDRQAVWQKQPQALYFRRDNSEVWRLPFARDGSPSGPATAWLILPRGLRLAADSLSINPSDDRLVTALTATASDIWLIELQ
jgi:Tol biopolymer transport system component